MSTPGNNVQPMPSRPLEVVVSGKVAASRLYEGRRYTLITCPAVDAYSRPQTVELRSKGQVGQRDELVTVRCRLGGFEGRQFNYIDKESGERKVGRNVNHTLDVIE